MSNHHSNKTVLSFFCFLPAVLAFLWPLQADCSERSGRSPLFSASAAVAALRFDQGIFMADAGSMGSLFFLGSSARPGKGLFGNSQMPELEPLENYGSFFGLNVTLKLKGGFNIYSGGDLEHGFGGMYDRAVDLITETGVPIRQNLKQSGNTGFDFGGDLIYCITPRFGIGVGAGRINAEKENAFFYEVYSPDYERLDAHSEINVTVLRLGLFYSLPIAERLAISFHGGPALYSARYKYNTSVTSGSHGLSVFQMGVLPTGLNQDAEAKQMGLEGGIGFEFNANPFVVFFIEALGRYARIKGFEGEEEKSLYIDHRYQVVSQEGTTYIIATDNYSLLDIIPPEESAGSAARKATLDFSGVTFSAGLKLRF
jgi:hypothetical protein